jgi:D-arabinose 5-phosphate isomerase GutQ
MSKLSARLERMRATVRREASVLAAVASELDEASSRAVDVILATKGHVLAGGAGTSNAVARRFAHLLSCSGQAAVFLSPADSLHGSSGAVTARDTVALFSKGGKTSEVNAFAKIVKERGAKLIAFTEAPESELGRMADVVVRVKIPAESDPYGMVATSSSLANAAVADAICETVLVEKGYTKQEFARTHPGGAVGKRIEKERILEG